MELHTVTTTHELSCQQQTSGLPASIYFYSGICVVGLQLWQRMQLSWEIAARDN